MTGPVVIVEPSPDTPLVSFDVTVRGGAAGRDEAAAGQAHLVHAGAGRAGPVFRYQP